MPSMENSVWSEQLSKRIQDYAEGRIGIKDDSDVFRVIANLPILREYQRQNSQLKCVVANMKEARRFLQSAGDSFCAMWDHFKKTVEDYDADKNK